MLEIRVKDFQLWAKLREYSIRFLHRVTKLQTCDEFKEKKWKILCDCSVRKYSKIKLNSFSGIKSNTMFELNYLKRGGFRAFTDVYITKKRFWLHFFEILCTILPRSKWEPFNKIKIAAIEKQVVEEKSFSSVKLLVFYFPRIKTPITFASIHTTMVICR